MWNVLKFGHGGWEAINLYFSQMSGFTFRRLVYELEMGDTKG